MKYYLYQMKDDNVNRKYKFLSSNDMNGDFKSVVVKDNYNKVYEGNVDGNFRHTYDDYIVLLEKLFEEFNVRHPFDFHGNSMSVSDVVVLSDNNKMITFYCDSFGWKTIDSVKWLQL